MYSGNMIIPLLGAQLSQSSVCLVCWDMLRMLVFVRFCPCQNLPKASKENIRKMPYLRQKLLNSLLFIEWTLHCMFVFQLTFFVCPAFSLDAEQPDYDLDSEDEAFVNRLKKKMEVGVLQFEQMIDRLEKGSGQQVSPFVTSCNKLQDFIFEIRN